jgi:hypothetical protein
MERLLELLQRRWRLVVFLVWLGTVLVYLWTRWENIRWFVLSDTDDNMRIMQVRAWLDGQGWYDLRQYRLNPPAGADIHWSRIVDLPIAGLKLLLTPLIGGAWAERWACAIAPLLPLWLTMYALASAARRLVAPNAYLIALVLLLCAPATRGMFVPMRIDHHGWQLAMLAVALAGIADPKRARGGAVLGLATAVSLSIGLEMLLYLALAGAAAVLMWAKERGEARRLVAYGGTVAGGTALGFLLFASYANRAPVCDALSPVWLSVVLAGGGIAVLLGLLKVESPWFRLALAAVGGAALAAGFALAWPHCLGRLEGVSPEAQALWLDNVREARPIYMHPLQTVVAIVSLPLIGLIGIAITLTRLRWKREEEGEEAGDPTLWLAVGALALLPVLLLLWQSRAGPAAQLLAVPGATALAWMLIPIARAPKRLLTRVAATVLGFLLVSGVLFQQAASLIPQKQRKALVAVNQANSRCPSLASLRAVALQPKGQVLTFVDLGPRLISVTHHSAVAGPYHRNDDDIVDVMTAFRGSADNARAIVDKRRIDYVLICPNMSESTIYFAEAKKGFYVQLIRGKVPAWLKPVALPANSPFRMWRVVKPEA